MKKISFTIVMLSCCSTMLIGGCKDPLRSYIVGSVMVKGAADAGVPLVQSGVMTHDEAIVYVKALDDANDILAAWQAVININGIPPSGLPSQLDVILGKLIDMQVAAIKRQKGGG